IDPWNAAHISQRLAVRGVPIAEAPYTATNLQAQATALLERFHAKTIDLFPDQQLIADLHSLKLIDRGTSFRVDASGRTKSGGHPDRASASLRALRGISRHADQIRAVPMYNEEPFDLAEYERQMLAPTPPRRG